MKRLNHNLEYDQDLEEKEEITQDQLKAIFEYNKNIQNLDTDYSSITPTSKVLVRVFLLEPYTTDNGILEPHTQLLRVPTNSGYGSTVSLESPFPYSNKAVVVAVPPSFSMIKPGNIVQLETNPIKPIVTGSGANASVHVPFAYMHPSAPSFEIPRDSRDKHYGYLLIPFHEISTIVA